MTVSGDQQTRERIYVYVLNDETRLTQPKRAAHPFDEIPLYICRESSTNQPFLCKTNPILSAVGGLQMNLKSYNTKDYENIAN